MSDFQKVDIQDKEQRILQRIEKAKKDLTRLQQQRRMEIGKLASGYGLDKLDNATLDRLFNRLAKEARDEHTA